MTDRWISRDAFGGGLANKEPTTDRLGRRALWFMGVLAIVALVALAHIQ